MRARPVEVDGLGGTLLEPEGTGPWPHALIIAGSGPTDRDGNSVSGLRTNAYRLLAEALAGHGIATLRFDKRGIGASRAMAPPESAVTIETFIADAVKLAEWLWSRPNRSRVAVIGHSEGALIGALMVQRVSVDRLVYLCGPGVSVGQTLRRQLGAPQLPEAFRAAARAALDEFDATGVVQTVPPELVSIFRPSVQPFLRSVWKLDPRAELERILDAGQRLMVIAGAKDIQISMEEAGHLFNLGRGQNTSVFATMSHTLKDARGRSVQELYGNPDLPLVNGLAEEIAGFM